MKNHFLFRRIQAAITRCFYGERLYPQYPDKQYGRFGDGIYVAAVQMVEGLNEQNIITKAHFKFGGRIVSVRKSDRPIDVVKRQGSPDDCWTAFSKLGDAQRVWTGHKLQRQTVAGL